MTSRQRTFYHCDAWPAACQAQGWTAGDADKRRAVALECMREVRGPLVTTSDLAFGDDEITALFCYLDFLAHPDDLDRSARWLDCKQDYHAYNRARQADWHEQQLYGTKKNKLDRDRFAGAATAKGEPLEEFDPDAIYKRHLTFASRHQKKQRAAGQNPASQDLASQDTAAPASHRVSSEVHVPTDPF